MRESSIKNQGLTGKIKHQYWDVHCHVYRGDPWMGKEKSTINKSMYMYLCNHIYAYNCIILCVYIYIYINM